MNSVFITGAAGFLGRCVVDELDKRYGDSIEIVMARGITDGDLRIWGNVQGLFIDASPTHVIHCAASVGGIHANQQSPGDYFYDNMQMGLNVVRACMSWDVRKLTFISTTCAYPDHCSIPFKIADLWNGYPEPTNAPYGIAKRACLTLLEGYRQQYGLEYVYPILANLYGPRDCFDDTRSHVIPALIKRFVEGQKAGKPIITVWGSGEASREFLFVTDAARRIVELTLGDDTGAVNVGSGDVVTIKVLCSMIMSILNYYPTIVFDADKPDGQMNRLLDAVRLDYHTPFLEGLRETIDWYKKSVQ